MKILIIGGSGYIGSSLVKYLNKLNISNNNFYDITIVDTNWFGEYFTPSDNIKLLLQDYNSLSSEFLNSFDTIILLAAHSSVSMCTIDPTYSMKNNVYNFINLCDKLDTFKKDKKDETSYNKKFIYMSSSSIYGDTNNELVNETCINFNPKNEYDLEKWLIDKYISSYNINYYGLRLGTVNGSSLNVRKDLMINAMVESAINNKQINITDGEKYRPILYINDLCRAINKIISSNNNSGIYNLASFNDKIYNIGKRVSEILLIPLISIEDKTTNYNFLISSKKFCDVYNFEFEGTIDIIVNNLRNNNNNNKDIRNIKIPINNESLCIERLTCRVCSNSNLELLLDFNNQPLANNYHEKNNNFQIYYPLKLNICKICDHAQLSHIINPEILFSNYQYVSGTSMTLKTYFNWLSSKINNENTIDNKTILEIACNDGSQLDEFKKLGWITEGVDPASNIVCNIKDHKIYNDFFTEKLSEKINKKYSVILAQNVFAHIDNLDDFLLGCKNLMDIDTTLYIQTSQCNMFNNNEFDTVYHEHHSFFSEKSMNYIVNKHGLYLNNIEKTNIHGDSFLFKISKKDNNFKPTFSIINYTKYQKNVKENINDLITTIEKYKNDGYKIIGYGAAAKGNTILNYTKIKLDYILDDQKSKWGLCVPGNNIEIKNPEYIKSETGKILIVVLAWNFIKEISSKIRFLTKDINIDISILQSFPKVEVNKMMKKDNLTVICHFYNEEYLLPFWLNNHKKIFDYGIMINYSSNDESIEIIKKIVPHWTIVNSVNKEFDAIECDNEVKKYESTIEGFKIALNVTEFIYGNLRDILNNKKSLNYRIKVYPMIDISENYYKDINTNIPLTHQRYHGDYDSTMRSHRFLHRHNTLSYEIGRHMCNNHYLHLNNNEAVILWYGFSPFNNNMIERMVQKNNRYSQRDFNTKSAFINTSDIMLNQMTNKNIIDFRTTDLSKYFKVDEFIL